MTEEIMGIDRAKFLAEYAHPMMGYCIDYDDAQSLYATTLALNEARAEIQRLKTELNQIRDMIKEKTEC